MRIVVDATSLLLPSAGVRNYLHYWLLALRQAAHNAGDSIRTYPPAVPLPALPSHETSAAGPLGTRLGLALVQFCNIRKNPAVNLFALGADVFHASQHAANRPRGTVTATIFDFSCWLRPQDHTPANVAATRRYGEKILKTSDGLIAISEHTRRDAVEILRIPEARIRVIYPGIADAFFEATPAQAAAVRSKYGLDAPYLLFVGCVEPRKNVRQLLAAYERLPHDLRRNVRLVVAGPFGWETPDFRERLERGEGVRYLGYVPEEDLPGLVAGSSALVYPSKYEGFGLPPAQAMAAGTPVIVSDASCLPEIVGGAGVVAPVGSAEALSDAMRRVLEDSELALDLAVRGRLRAAAFRWDAGAQASLDFFRGVAG